MTNDGENVGGNPMVDLRKINLKSNEDSGDPEDTIVVVPDAWLVYPVAVPERDRHYCRTLKQEEWAVTRHNRYRLGLRDATWNWTERASELGPGDGVQITDPLYQAFDYCGEVLSYHNGNHEAQVQLREEVKGRRLGMIDRKMITKIHGKGNNTITRYP